MKAIHHLRSIIFIITTLILSGALPTLPAHAEDGRNVKGTISIQATNTNCLSPIHICDHGTITGKITGTIDNTLTSATLGSTSFTYAGTVVITRKHGTLLGNLNGVFDFASSHVKATITIIGGTGRYQNSTGLLDLSGMGNTTAQTEVDQYTGFITHNEGNDDD